MSVWIILGKLIWTFLKLPIKRMVSIWHGGDLTPRWSFTNIQINWRIFINLPLSNISTIWMSMLDCLQGICLRRKEAPPTNLNTGQLANPNIDSPQPQQNPGKIPWTQMPEEPKPSNFNPSNTMPPLSHRPIPSGTQTSKTSRIWRK